MAWANGITASKSLVVYFILLIFPKIAISGPAEYLIYRCRVTLSRALYFLDRKEETVKLKDEIDRLRQGDHSPKTSTRVDDEKLAGIFVRKNPKLAASVLQTLSGTDPKVLHFILSQSDHLELLSPTDLRRYARVLGDQVNWKFLEKTTGRIEFVEDLPSSGDYRNPVPIPFLGTPKKIRIKIRDNPTWDSTVYHELAHRFHFQVLKQRFQAIDRKVTQLFRKKFRNLDFFYTSDEDISLFRSGSLPWGESLSLKARRFNPIEYWGYSVQAYCRKPLNLGERHDLKVRTLQQRFSSRNRATGTNHLFFFEVSNRQEAIQYLTALYEKKTNLASGEREDLLTRALHEYDFIFRDREVLQARDPELFQLIQAIYGTNGCG